MLSDKISMKLVKRRLYQVLTGLCYSRDSFRYCNISPLQGCPVRDNILAERNLAGFASPVGTKYFFSRTLVNIKMKIK